MSRVNAFWLLVLSLAVCVTESGVSKAADDGPAAVQSSAAPAPATAAPSCCAEPEPGQTTKTLTDDPTHVCPLIAVMFHGTYTTYYARLGYADDPKCREYTSYDGPNNLPQATCDSSGAPDGNCLTALRKPFIITPYGHCLDQEFHTGGIHAPYEFTLAPGATLVTNGIGLINFKIKNEPPATGYTDHLAQVFIVDFDPAKAKPPRAGEVKRFQLGYEVKVPAGAPSPRPQKSSGTTDQDGNVLTDSAPADAKQATVTVKTGAVERTQYHILLLRP
jgi:hypothetical protein